MTDTTSPTKVWIVHRSRYQFDDNYYIQAETPEEFYLSEDEAKLAAGYANLYTLIEYGCVCPPEGSELALEFEVADSDDDDSCLDACAMKLGSMSLDEACMFAADQENFEEVLGDREGVPCYGVVELNVNTKPT